MEKHDSKIMFLSFQNADDGKINRLNIMYYILFNYLTA
jgi:hypothetical protein